MSPLTRRQLLTLGAGVATTAACGRAATTDPRTKGSNVASDVTANNLTANGKTTLKGGTTATGPVVINQGATGDGLRIVLNAANTTGQGLQLFDHNMAPILVVLPAGGVGVMGDALRVFGHDVFNADFVAGMDGFIGLNQRAGGVMLFSGSADPNVTPPPRVISEGAPDRPFQNGDRYAQRSQTVKADNRNWLYWGTAWEVM